MNNSNESDKNDENKKALSDQDIKKRKVIIISESFPEVEWKNGRLIFKSELENKTDCT